MKVLQINTCLNTGSTGRIAEEIGRKVIENGGESYIAYGRSANPAGSVAIKIGRKLDQSWHLISTRLFDTHGFHSTRATRNLVRQIKYINPDIIHLHNLHGYYINIQILFNFLKEFKKPVVWTLHDFWPITGHCSFFSRINCEKWQTQCYSCPLKNKYPASLIFDRSKLNHQQKRNIFNSVNDLTIVTVSNWLNTLVNKSFLAEKYAVQTIFNGIDTSTFSVKTNRNEIRQKYGVNEKFVILSVANTWTNRKGINDLFELSRLIGNNDKIIMVGLSDKNLKNLPTNIIGIKKTENIEELADLYSAADVLISMSYEETFGMTIAEAMACGTPAIVYNLTATPELVSPETGFIVEPKDYSSILKIIDQLKKNGRSSYINSCRHRAESFFNKDKQYIDYLRLYERLFKNKNRSIYEPQNTGLMH